MNVIVAESAGFCFGVQRAVSICEKAAKEQNDCVTLGPIIHNEHVIRYLENMGVRTVTDIPEILPGKTVIIRAHGTGKKDIEELEALGANIIDATCPDVKRIHRIAGDESEKGRLVVIVGDCGHPEVVAISGWCSDYVVLGTAEELREWLGQGDNAGKPLSFVFQTTNDKSIYQSIVDIIKKECTNYNIFDTICDATRRRQDEAAKLSETADVMIVVGDSNSANSLRLANICRAICRKVFFVTGAEELQDADINKSDTIGITAGASTPAWIIKEVTQKMSEEVMLDETCEIPETQETDVINDERLTMNDEPLAVNDGPSDAVVEEPETIIGEGLTMNDEPSCTIVDEPSCTIVDEPEAVSDERLTTNDEPPETVAEEAEAEADSAEQSSAETFEEMLEKSIKTLHTGQKVTGIVTSITSTEVSVDLGAKQSGYIPISEFNDDSGKSIEELVAIGDQIESFVMRVNDVEGMIMLSKKRLDAIKNWDEIEAAKDSRAIVEGIVTEENKGGIVVNVKGVRVFIPASQTGLAKSAPMSALVKKPVKLRITEVNQSRRRVVGSIRAVQADERREKSDKLWEEIETGKQYDGVVKSMTSYGVFVDIGGVDGMIHISELSWTRIKQPSEVMAIGDEVSVYVLSFDKENRKISLGYKKKEDNPWTKFTTLYAVGDVVNVKIVKMMPFGAFAEICPGVDGLIHISQITDHRIGLPSEVLSDGQMVDVKITEINFERKKISLSIRALIDPSSQQISDADAAEIVTADNSPVIVYDTDAPPETIIDEEPETVAEDAAGTVVEEAEPVVEEAEVAAEEPEAETVNDEQLAINDEVDGIVADEDVSADEKEAETAEPDIAAEPEEAE